MTDYHVYGIGNALVDMEFEVSASELATLGIDKGLMTLISEERHHELLGLLAGRQCRRSSGGSAATSMITAAQLGSQVFYSCKVADDDTGRFYLQDMESCGVDSNLQTDSLSAGITGKCIVLITPDAERSMNTFLGATSDIGVAQLDESAIRRSRYVYIEGYLVPEPGAREAAMQTAAVARAAGVKTAITLSDVNMVRHFRDELLGIIGDGVDMLFCNEEEAMLMAGSRSISSCIEALQRHAARFAITRSEQGAVLFDGYDTVELPARTVRPVDCTGAGDVYAGVFLHGLADGLPFVRCGELAGAAATEVVTRFGARLPTADLRAIGQRFAA